MSPEGEPRDPMRWLFRAAMLVLGAVVTLNIAIAFLDPILPWIIGGGLIGAAVYAVVVYRRWRDQG